MNIVFVSNFFNHHQKELCEELNKITDGNFVFIQTKPMTEERMKLGWQIDDIPNYVVSNYLDAKSQKQCQQLIDTAGAVIVGSAPYEMVKKRLKNNKLVFFYSERIYKHKPKIYEMPLRVLKYYFNYGRYKNAYLLCASAYTASDYAKTRTFSGKAYKWGYFPTTKIYQKVDNLIQDKSPASILWAGRFLGWKHPELAIEVAKRLTEQGYKFNMNLIGSGDIEKQILDRICAYNLKDSVKMLGSEKQEEVRLNMEQSEIFLFTSDRNEGWGAVLNEAMNSGCAVVADFDIGSVPYLVQDGVNGLIYHNGDVEELTSKVKFLLDNQEIRKSMGRNAYLTIKDKWNAKVVAKRLISLINELEKSGECSLYSEGPCSRA